MEKEQVRVIACIAFVALLAYAALSSREQQWNLVAPWYDAVVTPGEVRAAQWVDASIPHWKLFAADLFSCEMLTAVAREHCSIGGAWELADQPNDRYWSNQIIFTTNSSVEAWDNARKYAIGFILVADRNSFYAYGWKKPQTIQFQDARYFKKIYDEGDTVIYEVAEK